MTCWGYVETTPMDAYTDIFRLGEGRIQKRDEPSGGYKTNPIVYFKNNNAEHGHYRIMFEDEFESCLEEAGRYDFAIMSGLTYFGRKATLENASKCYALIMDLDGVEDDKLNIFLSWVCPVAKKCPYPNYIALSGHGLHLYWVFDEPIDLYPDIKKQLKAFKFAWIQRIWNGDTSTIETPQYQGINQGFRPFGCKTKIDGVRVRVFKNVMAHPYTVEEMNSHVLEETNARLNLNQKVKMGNTRLEVAKERWPEWYKKRIINKEDTSHWAVSSNLYRWYLKQIQGKSSYGHRYFCILHLATIGRRCSIYDEKKNPNPITYEQVRADAYAIKEHMNNLNPNEPFTDSDIEAALECFDWDFANSTIETVSNHVGFDIKRNERRNGETQAFHLEVARFKKKLLNQSGKGNAKNAGRKSKRQQIVDYAALHPLDSPTEIARALGISRTTVYKWLKIEEESKQGRGLV